MNADPKNKGAKTMQKTFDRADKVIDQDGREWMVDKQVDAYIVEVVNDRGGAIRPVSGLTLVSKGIRS